jgi:drug/metabolite transporter (DMT)-like permease
MKEKILQMDFEFPDSSTFKNLKPVIQYTVAMICFALSALFNKLLKTTKDDFNQLSFMFTRFIFIGFFNMYVWKNLKEEVPPMEKEDKFWNGLRIATVFLGFSCTVMSINYLRLSTAVCLMMMYPIWASILSIFILKEKFYYMYTFGGILCFLGTIFMSINERKSHPHSEPIPLTSVLIGVFFGFSNSVVTAIQMVAAKIISKKFNSYFLNYMMGFCCASLSLIVGIFTKNFFSHLLDFNVLFYGFLNSIVAFFGFHYCNVSMKLIEINKITVLTYIQIVISVVAGYLIFDEKIFFMDFIGASLIIGFNIYSVWIISKDK